MAFFGRFIPTYSIPASFQKSLLRHVLSHIPLLDTEKLDLDQLDISWGNRSVVNLTDLGLNIKKLAHVLHLPDEIQVTQARVLQLRITIPADILSSGILVEVRGVQLNVRRSQKSNDNNDGRRKSQPKVGHGDKRGASDVAFNDTDDHLPTTEELAQSFLADETPEEIRELEVAVQPYLDDSESRSEISDDDEPVGTGIGPSLPAFVTNILDGIKDRLKVDITKVTMTLDSELPQDNLLSELNLCAESIVTVAFQVDTVEIEGLSAATRTVPVEETTRHTSEDEPIRRKRHIHLGKISARLITDPVLFASLDRVSTTHSPVATSSVSSFHRSSASVSSSSSSRVHRSPRTTRTHSKKHRNVNRGPSSSTLYRPTMDGPVDDRFFEGPSDRLDAAPEDFVENDTDRFADASDFGGDDDGDGFTSDQCTSLANSGLLLDMGSDEVGSPEHELPFSMDDQSDFTRQDLDEDGFDASPSASLLHDSSQPELPGNYWPRRANKLERKSDRAESSVLDDNYPTISQLNSTTTFSKPSRTVSPTNSPRELAPRIQRRNKGKGRRELNMADPLISTSEVEDSSVESIPSLLQPENQSSYQTDLLFASLQDTRTPERPAAISPVGSVSSGSSAGSFGKEDLSESKMFSHEEAESMYMSAMSGLDSKASTQFNIPGGWDRSSTSSGESEPKRQALSVVLEDQQIQQDLEEPGLETPRPGSPVGVLSPSESAEKTSSPDDRSVPSVNSTSQSGEPNVVSNEDDRVAKQLLIVDDVSVWVPWATNRESPVVKEDLSSTTYTQFSTYEGMPGAFSQHSSPQATRPTRASSPHPRFSPPPTIEESVSNLPNNLPDTFESSVSDLEIEMGTISSQIDISTARLLFLIFQQLIAAWTDHPAPKQEKVAKVEQTSKSSQSHTLKIKEILLSFVEQMPSTPMGTKDHEFESTHPAHDPLFLLGVNGVAIASDMHQSVIKANLEIDMFHFGFSSEEIISFDKAASTKAQKPNSTRRDISVLFSLDDARGPELHVKTLPLLVNLDMHQLDEQLSCFGGLSGVLDLSSSIASNGTILPASPNTRGKNVRFDTPSPVAGSNKLSPIKVNAKIDGMLFNLHGKACGVTLQNSSIRMVVREDKASLQIDRINFTGPFESGQRNGPPLAVTVINTKFVFLQVPTESDLTQLVELITPSRDPYEDDDDILLNTLLRQRKKGSLLRLSIAEIDARVTDIEKAQGIQLLSDEISKLSSVAKYLPEDDRPGLLSIASVDSLQVHAFINQHIGNVMTSGTQFRLAHVGLPALSALELGTIGVVRANDEEIVRPLLHLHSADRLPMIMARKIGDELEPTIKAKLFNVGIDYHIPTVMAIMGLTEYETVEELATSMAASVVTIRGNLGSGVERQNSENTTSSRMNVQPLHVDLLLRDCGVGLNPEKRLSKGLLLLTNTRFSANVSVKEDSNTTLELRKASLLLVDDVANIDPTIETVRRPKHSAAVSPAADDLCRQGYQPMVSLSSATAVVKAVQSPNGGPLLDIALTVELFLMHTCADSTQTLFALLAGLTPPIPSKVEEQFRTNTVVPIEDMMASFSGDAQPQPTASVVDDEMDMDDADQVIDDLPSNLDFVGSFYNPEDDFDIYNQSESPAASIVRSSVASVHSIPSSVYRPKPNLNLQFSDSIEEAFDCGYISTTLDLDEDHLGQLQSKAPVRRWNPNKNKFFDINNAETKDWPVRAKVTVTTFMWNLFDGYDWIKTRETIAKAVDDVQARAEQRRRERESATMDEDEEESEIGDMLFQSVWVSIPPNRDAGDLRRAINHNIDDLTSESGTVTTSANSRASQPSRPRRRSRSLKLGRGRHHKISFELRGVSADLLMLPPGKEITQMSVMVKIRDLEIFDHIPTSTWKKFMTYMADAGERQMDKPMIRLEIANVRPVADRAASELVMKVSVLPIRLHVDQDALDFITRFFEFKPEDVIGGESAPADGPFIQRIEVPTIRVKLDYKPKKVDYAGLRSGHLSEFANFFILDGAEFQLKHLIYYGIEAPDRLQKLLKDIWTADVTANQLPTVLAGLSYVRPLVDIGSGLRNLVVVPLREYEKDGRFFRSVQKGFSSFGMTTARELARLGAKVAIGTQTVAEGLEGLTLPSSPRNINRRLCGHDEWDEDEFSSTSPSGRDEQRAVSNYADQPLSIMTGLRSAYTSIERDLLTTKNTIIAMGSEVRDSSSATGAAGALLRRGPTVLLRPVIGGSKALGTVLSGAANQLDKDSRRRNQDKYK